MELRMVSPITGKNVEKWAFNFMMANKVIEVASVRSIKDRPAVFKLFFELNSKCNLGTPSIDEKGRLCVDFKSEKHKTAFILKYSNEAVWLPN